MNRVAEYFHMDGLNEIRYRMRITKLESKLVFLEIEGAALTREVYSPLTPPTRRAVAIENRKAMQTEWLRIMEQLKRLRELESA